MNNEVQYIDFTVNQDNLYREDTITDLNIASIRRLIPIKPDGTDDKSRTTLYVGHTQLISPQGPLPIQAHLQANTIQEAIHEFPAAMKKALEEMVEKIKKIQAQQKQKHDSRIIVPGR